jgi:broad specificity phosphatase PhoE
VTELLLIRHGETDWNRDGRWQGQLDVPLNAHGLEQAAALAEALSIEPLDAIFTSDLRRARQTAEVLAAATGASVVEDRRLREIHLGRWQGLTQMEISLGQDEALDRFRANPADAPPPEGETVLDVQRRMQAAVVDVLQTHPHGRVAIVSHGLALAALKASLLGLGFDTGWQRESANAEAEVFRPPASGDGVDHGWGRWQSAARRP